MSSHYNQTYTQNEYVRHINDQYTSITDQCMMSVWGRRPKGYQRTVIPYLLQMMNNTIPPQAVLLVQSTGSGKSAVPQTAAVVNEGVTIIIENTLAISSDQKSKIENAKEVNGHKLLCFQLDEVKSEDDKAFVSDFISSVFDKDRRSKAALSIIIFTSPETLIEDVWFTMFERLIELNALNLLCIDEVHLYVDFGLTFRKSFTMLKDKVFASLIDKHYNEHCTVLKVPVLFMTATFNKGLISLLHQMTGINISYNNYVWGDINDFKKRNIRISIQYSNQSFRVLKKLIYKRMRSNKENKAIICGNVAKQLETLKPKLDAWLDSVDEIVGDSCLVIGNQERELKFAYTVAFTDTEILQSDIDNPDIFYPRFLLGTSGCIGAGIDCSNVKHVMRIGMPTSITNFLQEMGRCGRKQGRVEDTSNNIIQDDITIIITLYDYVYLHERLYIVNDNDEIGDNDHNESIETNVNGDNNDTANGILTIEEERNMQHDLINEVARLLVLNLGCWHTCIEMYSMNPVAYHRNNGVYGYPPCINMCPYCDGSIKDMIDPIKKDGMMQFLAETFLCQVNVNGLINALTPITLATALFNFKDVGILVYGRKTKKAKSNSITQLTILQLIVSNILRLEIKESNNPKAYCKLAFGGGVDRHTPNYMIDNYWNGIRLIHD